MPISTFVAGDPQACYTCSQQITGFAGGMDQAAQSFGTANGNSESVWHGDAGNAFRDRTAGMNSGAAGIADQANSAASAVAALGDGLAGAKAQMRQAAEVAAEAGIEVQPNQCDPMWIMDPARPVSVGPMTTTDSAKFAAQQAAYSEALGIVVAARGIEKDAHAGLAGALNGIRAAAEDIKKGWYWLLESAGAGYVNGAIQQADKWSKIADANNEKAIQFRRFADEAMRSGDPFWESKAFSPVRFYEGQVDDAAKVVAANSKLIAGAVDNPLVRIAGASAGDLPKIGPALGEFGKKIPVLGAIITGGQTVYDLQDAKDKGDVVEVVAKDWGGFVAGTAATELLLLSASGGPATFGAVAVGVGVAWGTSEIIDHWDTIADWVPGL